MKHFIFSAMMAMATIATGVQAGEVRARQENQQDRIGQGVNSGQLTAGETARLEKREANLNKTIRQDRKQNGGNLTNNEKRQVNRRQNNISRSIYKDKHNAARQ